MLQDESSKSLSPQLDMPITLIVPVHDDGWRVVSRRKGSANSLMRTVGLAQVHIGSSGVPCDGGGGMDEGNSDIT